MTYSFSVIGGFFLRTLAWLSVTLALWFLAREYVVMPPGWLSERLLLSAFPGWISGIVREGTTITMQTTFMAAFGPGQFGPLQPSAPILHYCYGLPLFAALMLSCRANGLWWKLPTGAIILVPFQAWGVFFHLVIQTAAPMDNAGQGLTHLWSLPREVFALGYQLGYLLWPTLIPMLLWMVMERQFIATVAVDGAMQGSLELTSTGTLTAEQSPQHAPRVLPPSPHLSGQAAQTGRQPPASRTVD